LRSVVPAPHRAMVDPKAPGTVQDKSAARAGGCANQHHRALLGAGMVDKVWLFNGAVRAAVTAVGNVAADVERHLKPAGNANADRAALREAFEGQKPSAVRPSSSGVALAGAEDAPQQPPR
jgi:hypothetical protein